MMQSVRFRTDAQEKEHAFEAAHKNGGGSVPPGGGGSAQTAVCAQIIPVLLSRTSCNFDCHDPTAIQWQLTNCEEGAATASFQYEPSSGDDSVQLLVNGREAFSSATCGEDLCEVS